LNLQVLATQHRLGNSVGGLANNTLPSDIVNQRSTQEGTKEKRLEKHLNQPSILASRHL